MNTLQGEAHILKLFERARVMPLRDPVAGEHGRRHFLKRAEALRPSGAFITLPGWGVRRPAWAIVSVLLAVSLLLSGIGIARAASNTLPNEFLYPIKIAVEDLQVAFSTDDLDKVHLLLEFSQRRIDEITALAGQQQPEAISISAGYYRDELSQITAIIVRLTETDEPQARELSSLFTDQLIKHENTLSSLSETVQDQNSDIDEALNVSKKALSSEMLLEPVGRIKDMEPDRGKLGQTLTLQISGEGTQFSSLSLASFGTGVTVNWIYAQDNSHLVVNITITESAPLGWQEVHVTTGSLTWGGLYFDVEEGTDFDTSDEDNENEVLEDAETDEVSGDDVESGTVNNDGEETESDFGGSSGSDGSESGGDVEEPSD